jgi:hypothetical protein
MQNKSGKDNSNKLYQESIYDKEGTTRKNEKKGREELNGPTRCHPQQYEGLKDVTIAREGARR